MPNTPDKPKPANVTFTVNALFTKDDDKDPCDFPNIPDTEKFLEETA